MKASELIEKLEKAIAKVGDVDIKGKMIVVVEIYFLLIMLHG